MQCIITNRLKSKFTISRVILVIIFIHAAWWMPLGVKIIQNKKNYIIIYYVLTSWYETWLHDYDK